MFFMTFSIEFTPDGAVVAPVVSVTDRCSLKDDAASPLYAGISTIFCGSVLPPSEVVPNDATSWLSTGAAGAPAGALLKSPFNIPRVAIKSRFIYIH